MSNRPMGREEEEAAPALASLQSEIGYEFENQDLLRNSLTHRSFKYERGASAILDNERLEFLGDAVLSLVVSHLLYERPDRCPEGIMSRMRAEMVNERSLARLAREIGLGRWLFLGKGEEQSGGRDKDSLLANAMEALLGAMYLDGGLPPVYQFVHRRLQEAIATDLETFMRDDFKTQLQEVAQRRFKAVPHYELVRTEGPDHGKMFFSAVAIGGSIYGEGWGKNKKESEQAAARAALDVLNGEGNGQPHP